MLLCAEETRHRTPNAKQSEGVLVKAHKSSKKDNQRCIPGTWQKQLLAIINIPKALRGTAWQWVSQAFLGIKKAWRESYPCATTQ